MARHTTQGTTFHTEEHVGLGRQGRRLASATFPIKLSHANTRRFLVNICFLPYVHDQVRDIWMVLRAARDDPDSFELSVSNANGADLVCTLGLAPEPGGGPVPIEHFAGLVTAAARRHLDHRSPALATVEDVQKGRLTVVLVGRSEGYVERRLGDLMTLIQRSRAVGATHFGWG